MSNPHSRIRRAKRRSEAAILFSGYDSKFVPGSDPENPQEPDLCPTCGGEGYVDMTLGGIPQSDPHATCPDCDGSGVAKTQEG